MFRKCVGPSAVGAAATLALTLGLLNWDVAAAGAQPVAGPAAGIMAGAILQAATPMTGTEHAGHTMPAAGAAMTPEEHAAMQAAEEDAGAMPMGQPGASGGMPGMMAKMGDMQRMMARMQRMMASDMMGDDMPMSADMQKNMREMMAMMADMQAMMGDMQGMMAGDMAGMGQMGGQQSGGGMMGGGMMGQMPMMGTMIVVMPMPMMGGMDMGKMMGQMPMMQGGMDMGKMMGQMPMMQGGMDMGSMMGGQNAPQGRGPAAAAAPAANPVAAPQTGQLGAIEVKLTPPDLTNIQGETFDFTVDLNASGADLSFDLSKLATLVVGEHKMPAVAWEVALDHGHHVNGVLKFPAHMQGAIERATVVITDPAGGSDLQLTWPPAD